MKKIKNLAVGLLLVLCMAFPAFAALQDMHATVMAWTGNYNQDGSPGLTKVTSGIQFQVLAQGADTLETLYVFNSKKLTSLTNPVTTTLFASTSYCNKEVAFKVDPTDTHDTKVDLIVTDTNGGYTAFVADFDKYTHTIVIDERPNILHHGIAYFTHAAGSATAIDTEINFLPKTFIQDVRVEVITTDAAITMGVGTADTATGFRAAISLASAGFVADTGVVTAGSTLDYTAASTYGALLYTAITGTDGVATGGGRSYLGHVVNTSGTDDDLYYTLLTGADTAHGYIHYFFVRLR
jgi:hypothetical protein